MPDNFKYDVFLSHSSKDKDIVRAIAERLRVDGLRVWFDEWVLKPGDNLPKKLDNGLEESRVLVLCMSAYAFGSDWTTLESYTFRFRDPLNLDRRFIPLRLDAAPISGSLTQFLFINWLPEVREQEYVKLLQACRPLTPPTGREVEPERELEAEKAVQLDYKYTSINAYAFSKNGEMVLAGSRGGPKIRLWDVLTGRCLRVLKGHTQFLNCIAWGFDQHYALSGADDRTIRLWDITTGHCLRVLEGHTNDVMSVAFSADQRYALSGSRDKTVRLWDVGTGRCLRVLPGHTREVFCVDWSAHHRALSGSQDNTLRLWDVDTGRCLRVLEGHTNSVWSLAMSVDLRQALSGSRDNTIRLWDLDTGRCLRVLEGHTENVISVAWSVDQRRAISGSVDNTLRLWDLESGRCLRLLRGHQSYISGMAWGTDQRRIFSGDSYGSIRLWDLPEFVTETFIPETSIPVRPASSDQIQYTNAKVLLVGESGAGKTGLSKRLALDDWQPSDSTVGAWATQWKLPVSSTQEKGERIEREIWLWDFGGQADQRLIHQLYMDETALAVLVFDGQKEDLFETLGQWDRDLTRSSRIAFTKLLVAGRIDAGGLRVSRSQVETFAKERGYSRFLETSAKVDICCEDLKQSIIDGIPWENIPWRSSPLLFKQLKEEIVRLKDEGRVLMRFNELRETPQYRTKSELKNRDEWRI